MHIMVSNKMFISSFIQRHYISQMWETMCTCSLNDYDDDYFGGGGETKEADETNNKILSYFKIIHNGISKEIQIKLILYPQLLYC